MEEVNYHRRHHLVRRLDLSGSPLRYFDEHAVRPAVSL